MTRYVTIAGAKSYVSATHTPEMQPTCTVLEAEKTPVETGLLDSRGHKIFRVAAHNPIGFQPKQKARD